MKTKYAICISKHILIDGRSGTTYKFTTFIKGNKYFNSVEKEISMIILVSNLAIDNLFVQC